MKCAWWLSGMRCYLQEASGWPSACEEHWLYHCCVNTWLLVRQHLNKQQYVLLGAHNCYWISRSCTNCFKEAAGRLFYKHTLLSAPCPTARAHHNVYQCMCMAECFDELALSAHLYCWCIISGLSSRHMCTVGTSVQLMQESCIASPEMLSKSAIFACAWIPW